MNNAGDEEQVQDLQNQIAVKRRQELEDIRNLTRNPSGLRFLKRLFAEGKVFQTTFTGNSQTFFLEGHRNLALKFLHDVVEAAPETLPRLMLQEERTME